MTRQLGDLPFEQVFIQPVYHQYPKNTLELFLYFLSFHLFIAIGVHIISQQMNY
jgi:ABC-type polysaccharide transport system permease subunit